MNLCLGNSQIFGFLGVQSSNDSWVRTFWEIRQGNEVPCPFCQGQAHAHTSLRLARCGRGCLFWRLCETYRRCVWESRLCECVSGAQICVHTYFTMDGDLRSDNVTNLLFVIFHVFVYIAKATGNVDFYLIIRKHIWFIRFLVTMCKSQVVIQRKRENVEGLQNRTSRKSTLYGKQKNWSR